MLDSLIAGMVVAGRYRLDKRFASAAWGSLWHGHDEKAHLNCTVRLADAGVVDLKAVRQRFEREVRAANALRCENVVNVLDHGEWSGMPFVVFESLSGEDLATRLQREGRLPSERVLEIVSDVAHALSRAHELGIVHRDLKPENIFLIRVGTHEVAKVLDFGIAGGEGSALHRSTKVGHHLGLPLYASPEQVSGKNVDFRSDLWSLAAIAYHCLLGHPPFQAQSLDELLTQISSASIPKAAEIDAELPKALDEWSDNALSRNPELRFQSAQELSDALDCAFQRTTLAGHRSPEWKTRERRSPEADSDDLAWLENIPEASAGTATGNGSAGPLSRQRTSWGFGALPGARRKILRASVGAVLGLMVVTLGLAIARSSRTGSDRAEVAFSAQARAPAQSLHVASSGLERGAAVHSVGGEAADVVPAPNSESAPATADPPVVTAVEDAQLTPAPAAPVPCQVPPAAPVPGARREVGTSPRLKPASLDGPSERPAPKTTPRSSMSFAEPDYGI